MPRRRALAGTRSPATVALGVLFLLFLPGLAAGHGPAAVGSPTPAGVHPGALCAGAATSSTFSGSLIVVGGGASPPSVVGVSFTLSYWVDLNFTPKNASSTFSCIPETAPLSTDGTGTFVVAAPLPTSSCNKFSCSLYSGPFGPLAFAAKNATPSGYFLTQSVSGSQVGLAFVAALSSTRIAPTSRVTLSADAPTIVRAYPTAGNGAPSPASVGYAWRLSGNGWSLLNGATGPNATIEAFDGATPGTLTVWVNGTYNGTALAAPPITLDIAAASTTTNGESVDPTALDVGYPATFVVTGQGAGGYAYHADLFPGLGLGDVVAPCTDSVVAGGLVALTCSTTVAYDRAGATQPTANLTNGFSSASWTFLPLTVAPNLAVSISPAAVRTYAGASTSLAVSVDAATGTAPRGPSCLWPGTGQVVCEVGPGPSYSFTVAYGTAGSYEGRATVADESGANQSVPFSAQVVDRPILSALVASTNILSAGQSASIVGSVSGGAYPMTYWWNASSPRGTLFEGTLSAAGPIVLTFAPRTSGSTRVNLTLVDGLGTVLAQSVPMNVSAGPATALRFDGAGNRTLIAGNATPVSWTAVDAVGETVPGWSDALWLSIAPSPGYVGGVPRVWVNVSAGPRAADANGSFPLLARDWASGTLRVTVDFAGAGGFRLSLLGAGPLLAGATSGIDLAVTPDPDRLVLSDPQVVEAGLRTNRTLWQIADGFGDPFPGSSIRIVTTVDGVPSTALSRILGDARGGTSVWVNFSVPDGVAATVEVLTLSGGSLRPTLSIPAPSNGPGVPWAWLAIGLGIAMAAGAAFGLSSWRRRPTPPPPEGSATEEDLRRWAEGRAHVLLRASTERGETLDELAKGFVGKPPRPEEMTDWVASLVADGSLRTVLGDDGRSRFLKAAGEESGPPRVQLDDRALADALDRRGALDRDRAADEDEPA